MGWGHYWYIIYTPEFYWPEDLFTRLIWYTHLSQVFSSWSKLYVMKTTFYSNYPGLGKIENVWPAWHDAQNHILHGDHTRWKEGYNTVDHASQPWLKYVVTQVLKCHLFSVANFLVCILSLVSIFDAVYWWGFVHLFVHPHALGLCQNDCTRRQTVSPMTSFCVCGAQTASTISYGKTLNR